MNQSLGNRLTLQTSSNGATVQIPRAPTNSDRVLEMAPTTTAATVKQIVTRPPLSTSSPFHRVSFGTATSTSTTQPSIPIREALGCLPVEAEEGMQYKCFSPANIPKISDCEKPAIPGTKMLVTCKTHYKPAGSISYTEMFCLESGKWEKKTRHTFVCTLGKKKNGNTINDVTSMDI